jgi:membrane associated rhomboid family serine protease
MIVMIALFSALALGFIQLLRLIGAAITHRTIRRVVDRDPASAERLLEQLATPAPRTGDDRLAIILIAIGIAMAAGAVIAIDDPGPLRVAVAASLFPLLVGGALWLRLYLIERRRRASGQ